MLLNGVHLDWLLTMLKITAFELADFGRFRYLHSTCHVGSSLKFDEHVLETEESPFKCWFVACCRYNHCDSQYS